MMCGESCGDSSISTVGEIRPRKRQMYPASPPRKTKKTKIQEEKKTKLQLQKTLMMVSLGGGAGRLLNNYFSKKNIDIYIQDLLWRRGRGKKASCLCVLVG